MTLSPSLPPSQLDPIPNVMPAGGVSILGGLPHAGKSRLLASWCKAWMFGGYIFDVEVPRINVCILATDRSWNSQTKHWFTLSGIPEIAAYSIQDDEKFDWKALRRTQERPQLFETCIARTLEIGRKSAYWDDGLPTVIVCDTVAPFIPKTMDYNDTFVSISSIRKLASARDVSILGTMHAPKLKGNEKERYVRLTDRIAGSVAISGTADTMFYLAIPEEVDEPNHVLEWRPHNAIKRQFALSVGMNGLFLEGEDRALLPEKKKYQALLDTLDAGETVERGDLEARASQAGLTLTRSTLNRWISDMVKDGKLIRLSRGRYRTPAIVVDMKSPHA